MPGSLAGEHAPPVRRLAHERKSETLKEQGVSTIQVGRHCRNAAKLARRRNAHAESSQRLTQLRRVAHLHAQDETGRMRPAQGAALAVACSVRAQVSHVRRELSGWTGMSCTAVNQAAPRVKGHRIFPNGDYWKTTDTSGRAEKKNKRLTWYTRKPAAQMCRA